ncbi:MAG: hypothetical protein AB1416_05750 [Actinomycetota bacterium]
MTCALCGHLFDPQANAACPSCPLHGGCLLACCPQCGHDTVDPAGSALVALGARIAARARGAAGGAA